MRQNVYDDEAFFQGYADLRAQADTFNTLVEQPGLRRLLPALMGLRVLDLGCGLGDLAADCADAGAMSVTATDISGKMLDAARVNNRRAVIDYRLAAMEDLEFSESSFDLVVSSLALHYVADYAALAGRIARWLAPGGRFVFSTEHPICTADKARQGWVRGADGQRLFWAVDDYGAEGRREFSWFVDGVVTYHRTLATQINTLLDSGLAITAISEPEATDETIARLPSYESTRRCPPFLIVAARKPSET